MDGSTMPCVLNTERVWALALGVPISEGSGRNNQYLYNLVTGHHSWDIVLGDESGLL